MQRTKPQSSMNDGMNFSKNRRIAFLCLSSSLGGLELSMLKLAAECNQRQAECILIVPPDTPLAQYAAHFHLTVKPLKTRMKYGDVGASLRLARILRSHNIDVVVMMQSKDMSIVTIAHLVYPCAKLVFYQEMQFGINKRDILHTWMYSHLSLWITLTQKMKQEVLEHTRMSKERIRVVPIGTDMRRFNPDLYNKTTTRLQFGIPQQKTVIGLLGRLDPLKGQEQFIRAIQILLKHQADVHCVIAGDETKGEYGFKGKLMELIQELEVSNYVQFLPFTDAVPEFMSAIDIFVLPSYAETFGFVLVEALAMGKVIVATNSGGVPEIITDGSTGLLVPPRNVLALAEAILKLLKDQKLRSSCSSAARAEALKRFDIARCVDQLVHTLDTL
jgi:glycosyltransferase involved in cell wall biosynthesis